MLTQFKDVHPLQWRSKNLHWTAICANRDELCCLQVSCPETNVFEYLLELVLMVSRILQTFSRVDSRQDEPPMFRSDIVLQPANGVKVAFQKE